MKRDFSASDAETIQRALQQVESLAELVNDLEYKEFLNSHLLSIEIELKRQLSHYIQ